MPPGRCARIYLPTGLAMHSDHPLGRTPRPPRPEFRSPQALQDTPTTDRCPLPPGSEAVHCKSSTAHCPQLVRQCIAGVALSAAPRK